MVNRLIIIIFSLIFWSSCSKYDKVSSTKFIIGKITISSNFTQGFIAGRRIHDDPEKQVVWKNKLSSVDSSINKNLPSGRWSFYGVITSDDTVYCALQTEELNSPTQTIDLIFTTSTCENKGVFKESQGEMDLIFCTEYDSSDPTCLENRSHAQSFMVTGQEIELSNISSPDVKEQITTTTGCVSIIDGKSTSSLKKLIQQQNQYPMPGVISIFSDETCTTKTGSINFSHLFFNENFIVQNYLEENYLLVIDTQGEQCVTNATCPKNYECVAGTCLGSVGATCEKNDSCASELCHENLCSLFLPGMSCLSDGQCKLGLCESNICHPKLLGETCEDSAECASGHCENDLCTQTSYFLNSLAYNNPLNFSGDETGDNFITIEKSPTDQTLGVSLDGDFSIITWIKTNQRNRGNIFGQKEIIGQSLGQIGLSINGAPYSKLANQENVLRFNLKDQHGGGAINAIVDLNDFNLKIYDSTWHQISITRKEDQASSNTTLKIYVDKAEVYTETLATVDFPVPGNHRIFLGARSLYSDETKSSYTNNSFFVGEMDEFSIFDSGLEDDEIITLYDDNKNHDLRYNFGKYTSSKSLKTYLKMNINPEEKDILNYKNSTEDFKAVFHGTLKDDLSVNSDHAPNTLNILNKEIYVGIPYQELSFSGSSFTCVNGSYPASNSIDGNLGNFSHTLNGCPKHDQNFILNESYYVKKLSFFPRGGNDRRLRNVNLTIFEETDHTTPLLNFNSLTGKNINQQTINFNSGTAEADWLNLILVSGIDIDFFNGTAEVYSDAGGTLESSTQFLTTSYLPFIDKINIERIADEYFDNPPGYTEGQRSDDKKVLQLAEFKAWGLNSTMYTNLLSDCSNGVRDYFETDIDCGGSFCPAVLLAGSCLGSKTCFTDTDCLSKSCIDHKCTQPIGYDIKGDFTPTVENITIDGDAIHGHDIYSSNGFPNITLTNSAGLTTQVCLDQACVEIIGEVYHTENSMTFNPTTAFEDGEHEVYFRATNYIDYTETTEPVTFVKYTPSANGETCEYDTTCEYNNCEDNICRPLALGELCLLDDQCKSGYCDSGQCIQTSYFLNSLDFTDGQTGGSNSLKILSNSNLEVPGPVGETEFSISLWFKPEVNQGSFLYESRNAAATTNGHFRAGIHGCPYHVVTNINEVCFTINDDSSAEFIGLVGDVTDVGLDLTDKNWHLFTVVKKLDTTGQNATLSLYIDDQLITDSTMAISDFPIADDQTINIGTNYLDPTNLRSFYGRVDEFAIWERGLTSQEVASLYENNRAEDYRYPFGDYIPKGKLKTYVKMNVNLEATQSDLISYSSKENTWLSSFVGTVKNDSSTITDNGVEFMPSFYKENKSFTLRINPSNLSFAQGTTATLGSTWPGLPASHAIDNNLTSYAHTDSVFAGNSSLNWFRLNLPGSSYVRKVEFSNRSDCCTFRMNNIEVLIGDSAANLNPNNFNFAYSLDQGQYINPYTGAPGQSHHASWKETINFSTGTHESYQKFTDGTLGYNLAQVTAFNNVTIPWETIELNHANNYAIGQYVIIDRAPGDPNADQGNREHLQLSEVHVYGHPKNNSTDQFYGECSNGIKDLHEDKIDCGGSFCSECLIGFDNSGNFVATPSDPELTFGEVGTSGSPEITVSGEVGLITQLCIDANCNSVIAQVTHDQTQKTIAPGLPLIDGDYTFYFRTTNGSVSGDIIGPLNYKKFTPTPINKSLMNVRASSAWKYDERGARLIDDDMANDFGTGSEDALLTDSEGTLINMQDEHYADIILERPVYLSKISLYNRTECCLDRLNDLNIHLFDEENNEIENYHDLNLLYYSNTGAVATELMEFDLTSEDPAVFGLGAPVKVKRIKIVRHRHEGGFGYPNNEAAVQLGLTEISLFGYAPENLAFESSVTSPSNYSLEEPGISINSIPEITVNNSIGNITELCEDAECFSVIGWVYHDVETKIIKPMAALPLGNYSFYLRSVSGSNLSGIEGPINYQLVASQTIPSNQLSISGTQNWPGEPLGNLIDGNAATLGSTGLPDIDDIQNINLLAYHHVVIAFNEEKIIDKIILVQRSNCCTDRINDYDIILYQNQNGVDVPIADYYSNNNNRYFCEDRTFNNGTACNFGGGAEIVFDLGSSNKEIFGLGKPKTVSKVEIRRHRNTNVNISTGGEERFTSIGFLEIKFKGYVP